MRTVTCSAACSLDGYISANDGSCDWLHFSPEVDELMGQYWSTVDAVPFFRPQARRLALELTESRTIDDGCVLMTYRVRNGADEGRRPLRPAERKPRLADAARLAQQPCQ